MFGLSNFVTGAFNQAKDLVTKILKPKANTQTPSGTSVYNPPPVIQPKIQSTPAPVDIAPKPVVTNRPAPIAPPLAQAMIQEKMTNNIDVAPSGTTPSSSLDPKNTMSTLLQTRKKLEEKFLTSLEGSDNTRDLAKIRLEAVDLQEKFKKEYEKLQANPEGKTTAQLRTDLTLAKEKQNEQLGYLAMRESALTGAIALEKDEQKTIIDNIKQITAMSQEDMVGGLQTDPVTGEIFTFFQNPETGELTQKTVGQTSIKPNLDIRNVGGRVVALDAEGNIVKDIGSSSSSQSETSMNSLLAAIPDFNEFLAQREQQLQMSLTPQAREELKKEYTQAYASIINQTLVNKFDKTQIGKLSAAGLIGASTDEQIKFLYGQNKNELSSLSEALAKWDSIE